MKSIAAISKHCSKILAETTAQKCKKAWNIRPTKRPRRLTFFLAYSWLIKKLFCNFCIRKVRVGISGRSLPLRNFIEQPPPGVPAVPWMIGTLLVLCGLLPLQDYKISHVDTNYNQHSRKNFGVHSFISRAADGKCSQPGKKQGARRGEVFCQQQQNKQINPKKSTNTTEKIDQLTLSLVHHIQVITVHLILIFIRRVFTIRFFLDSFTLSFAVTITVTIFVTLSFPVTIAVAPITVPVTVAITVTPSVLVPVTRNVCHTIDNNCKETQGNLGEKCFCSSCKRRNDWATFSLFVFCCCHSSLWRMWDFLQSLFEAFYLKCLRNVHWHQYHVV